MIPAGWWQYDTKPIHSAVLRSRSRHRCVAAARRSGKTGLGQTDALLAACQRNAQVGYFLPKYAQVRELVLEPMAHALGPARCKLNRNDHRLDIIGGGTIWGKSTEQPDNLVGRGYHHVILDECELMPDVVYDQIVRPMLATTGGRVTALGSPRGKFNLLHRFFELGQARQDEWESWHLTAYDAGMIPREEIERSRVEAERAGPTAYKRWKQEWLASFEEFIGQVFSTWDPAKHVFGADKLAWIKSMRSRWSSSIGGVDFGFAEGHAGAIEAVIELAGIRYVVEESSHFGRTIAEFWSPEARRIEKGWSIETYWTDTGGGAVGVLDCEADVLPVKKYPGSVQDGVECLAGEIEGGRMFVYEGCKRLLQHIPSYTWEQARDGEWKDKPKKQHDDEIDAWRYAVASELLGGGQISVG